MDERKIIGKPVAEAAGFFYWTKHFGTIMFKIELLVMIQRILSFAFLGVALLCCNFSYSASANPQQEKFDATLVKAVNASKTDEARSLLRRGASANAVGKDGESDDKGAVLKIAAENNSLSIVKMLLWRGADVNAKSGDYQTSALLFATRNKNIPIMKWLIKNGADVNSVEGNGWSPLSIAKGTPKSIHDYAVIRLLREFGAKEVPASED